MCGVAGGKLRGVMMGGIGELAAGVALLMMIGCKDDSGAPVAGLGAERPLIEYRLASDQPSDHLEPAELDGEVFYLEAKPVLSDPDFFGADAAADSAGLVLTLCLNEEAVDRINRATTEGVGRYLGLLLDGTLRSAPVIRDGVRPTRIRSRAIAEPGEAENLIERIRNEFDRC